MGALFSHLGRARARRASSFGRALGVNTLGAAAAPRCSASRGSRAGAQARAAADRRSATSRSPRGAPGARPPSGCPAARALALAVLAPPLAFIDVPDGGRVVSYREGVMAAVSVVEDAAGVARLRINNRQQEGSSATFRFDARQAWLPLLLHPAPRRALFLGLGTGVTASSAADDPT